MGRSATIEKPAEELALMPDQAKLPAAAQVQVPAQAEMPAPDNMLALIERLACTPNADVEKFAQLLALREKEEAKAAKREYQIALAEMQDELPVVAQRGEIRIREDRPGQKYAKWEDINEAIKPVLKKHGFALSFRIGQDEKQVTVTGVLSHSGGHAEETTIHLPVDTSGSKNAVQAVGSSVSYGKRYSASALLNLVSRGEDDDGTGASGSATISETQLAHLQRLMDDFNADREKFCRYFKIESLPDLPAKKFDQAVAMLNLKDKKVQGK